MFKFVKYALLLITLFVILSCSKRIITSAQDGNYIPYSETLDIKKVNMTNLELRSIISDFINEVKIFEHGVNSFSPYPIDYFISVRGFCRNDSSLIVLKATAGSYMFYGHANDLDERMLEQFRLAEVDKNMVLIARDIEESFCTTKKLSIYEDSTHKGEFKLNWYRKSNGDRLIALCPYFFRILYLNGQEIESVELVFPDLMVELN